MTLSQLRTFLAVADRGSVRAAAEELVVTQAAVSASLGALQKSLGPQLTPPEGRGLRLTDAGAAYIGFVRRILGLLDEAGRAAASAADPDRGELRIAAVTTAAEQLVPGLLRGFRRDTRRRACCSRRETATGCATCSTAIRSTWFSAGGPSQAATCGCMPFACTNCGGRRRAGSRRRRGPAPGGPPPGQTTADGLLPWLASQTWLLREPGSSTRSSTEALLSELDITPLTLTVARMARSANRRVWGWA